MCKILLKSLFMIIKENIKEFWPGFCPLTIKELEFFILFRNDVFLSCRSDVWIFDETRNAGTGQNYYDPQTYNALFTLHGVIMIFLFIIPGIPAVFGNFFLPIMLGAKDVSFPRLNLLSWYFYIIGAGLVLLSLILPEADR